MIGCFIIHWIIRCTVIRSRKESCLKTDIEHLFHQHWYVQMKRLCFVVGRIRIGDIQQRKLAVLVIICIRNDADFLRIADT